MQTVSNHPRFPGVLPEMSYLLFLPEIGRYIWGIDGEGLYRTTHDRNKAWRLYEREARKHGREVIMETGCTVELQPARQSLEAA